MNLASGKSLSILELAHLVSDVFKFDYDRDIPVIFSDGTTSDAAEAPAKRFHVSTKALSQLMPSLQLCPLKDGIKEVIEYIQQFDLYKL